MRARCTRLGSRSQPNSHSPRNVDSKKKASQALHRQRRAEHVADEPRVRRPVHPELELLDEPGDDADGHVDQQQRPEEARQPLLLGVAGAVPGGLEDRDQEREPDRHGHEQEVVDARRRELPARKIVLILADANRNGSRAHHPNGVRAATASFVLIR